MKQRIRPTFASRLKIGTATIWQLPAIFLLMHSAARDGFFSSVLLEDAVQLPLLLRLLGVVLFGYLHVPGHFFVRAKIRVAMLGDMAIGHTLLIRHRNKLELAACAIQSAYRRCGVGKQLLEDAIFVANKMPIDAVCMPKSHAMGMLLRKIGFIDCGTLRCANASLRHWRFIPPALAEKRETRGA